MVMHFENTQPAAPAAQSLQARFFAQAQAPHTALTAWVYIRGVPGGPEDPPRR